MLCPKCDEGQMVTVNEEDVQVERCDNCHGLYFSHLTREDLSLILDHVHIDTGDEDVGAEYNEMVYVECPNCDRIMDQRLLEDPVHIRFEICTSCHATFLDAGEFRQYVSDDYCRHFMDLLPDN